MGVRVTMERVGGSVRERVGGECGWESVGGRVRVGEGGWERV